MCWPRYWTSWWNAHECSVTRWGRRSRTRSRMPVRSSRAIPRPVRSAPTAPAGHDALGDAVVGVGGEPGFLAAAFLQQPLGGFGADGLEFRPEPLVAVPDPVHGLAAVVAAVGVGGEVGDAEVDAEEPVRFLGRNVGDVAGGIQQPLPIPADQVRLAAAVRGQGG